MNIRSTKDTKGHEGHNVVFFVFFFVSFVLLSINNIRAQQTEKLYLSGTGNDNTVNWQFFCTAGMNSGKWTTIPVPSCWELQGFGKYDYGFAKDSVRGKEKGLYKYSFTVPASWKAKKVNIVFEGSMTDTEVKINGKSAGAIHQGAFYAFRYDISQLIKYGASNLLEVTVSKHSANESVNAAERRADFWIFGGIFRPVWLEALPEVHIKGAYINAKAAGKFEANIEIVDPNISQDHTGHRVEVAIYDAKGNRAGETFSAKGGKVLTVSKTISGINPWSSEFPNLYKAVFTLFSADRKLHTIEMKFGFRTVEVKQRDGIYINGVKVKLKGVNRHSFRPETGRTLSRKNSIEDVLLMKDMNMNAVRMSHYPPDDHFLDVCDSLGLFVMDELAGWHGHYDTPTGTKLVKEMLEHDINHPSIIIWANGNEGGHNVELDSLFKEIQGRPVVHPWQLFGGIETQHYREYNYGIGNYENGREILLPTEFLHGQFDGGHGAGLEDYWEKMWHNPLSAGGFLWDFADQGVVRKDKNDSLDTDKHRGADGIIGPHHEKEGSYYAIKEIWSPVYFEKKYITDGFDGRFNIENRYHFTNISQCRFTWNLQQLGADLLHEASGSVPSPDIKPSGKGVLTMKLPADWKKYDVLFVTAIGPDNREIFRWSFPIVRPAATVSRVLTKKGSESIIIDTANSVYRVSVGDLRLLFNKDNGLLQEVKNGDQLIPFNNGPVIQEGANNFKNFSFRFDKADSGALVIESLFDRKSSYNTLRWTIYHSGWIKMEVNYFPAEYFTSMAGVNFSFPEKEIKKIVYMGNGPYRVWKNRMKGNNFDIWNKAYNNTETGEAPWDYPEFKGYHSNIYWCKFITATGSFRVFTENEDLFLRLFTPAWKTDQWHNYEPIFPSGDISFMQGIPGIGSKTQRNETTGPMGMKNIFYDYEKDPARALKLVLYFDFSGK